MKAVVWTGPHRAGVQEVDEPAARGGEAVLTVRVAGICGSDLHVYRGHQPRWPPPRVLGHEVVGSDEDGRLCVLNPIVGCGACRLCRGGETNLCLGRALIGLDRPGGFAQRVAVPRDNLLPVPEGMSPETAALVEPMATPLSALRRARLAMPFAAVVIGCGPIGLLAVSAARHEGAGFIACYDRDPERIPHVAASVEAAGTRPDEIVERLRAATEGLGADIVIDAVGVEGTWTAAFDLVRPGGVIAQIGLGQGRGTAPVAALTRHSVRWDGFYAYRQADFAAALDLLSREHQPCWVSSVSLDEVPKTLESLARGVGPVKALLTIDP